VTSIYVSHAELCFFQEQHLDQAKLQRETRSNLDCAKFGQKVFKVAKLQS